MTSELVVDVSPKEVSIALLEDSRLVELQKEGREESYAVGNIYAAKVKKILPGLNACFVDVGHGKDAFLHIQEMTANFTSYQKYLKHVFSDRKRLFPISKVTLQPPVTKDQSIQTILKAGDVILAQIIKEPISTKGPRLTCELSFAGRLLVLIPMSDKVSVSSKIKSSAERSRLKLLIQSIKPKNFGVIVRTVAEGKRAAELDAELKILLDRWQHAIEATHRANSFPRLVYEETSRTVAMLRDIYNPTFSAIHVNDKAIFAQIQQYIGLIAPGKEDIVKLYTGALPIFDNFAITKQIKSSFGRTVTYKHGAYLIIEQTEALCVIDVNSGNRIKNPDGQEGNALEVNLGAADEIARQLRLRDVGGIIVIDFIDMAKAEHRQELYERMTKDMQGDRSRHNILPLSKFGLMQITRQRVRPVLTVNVEETCPSCFGTGKVRSSILFTDTLESKIKLLVGRLGIKKYSLHVHPYVAAYINKGLISLKKRWQLKYGLGLRVIPNQDLAFLEYRFYDADGQQIDLKEEHELPEQLGKDISKEE